MNLLHIKIPFPSVKTWYLAAHKYLYFILRIAIEIEEFLVEFFGMHWENFLERNMKMRFG